MPTYRVVHETRYDYASLVASCHNEVHLTPRSTERQRLLSHDLLIEPMPEASTARLDFFGNAVQYFAIEHPHSGLRIVATSEVGVEAPPPQLALGASEPWEEAARRTARGLDESSLDARQHLLDSPLCARSDEVDRYAAPSFAPGRPVLDAVLDLCHRINAEFAFDPGFTTLATPLHDVLAHRRGVCQDFAHLMIASLRGVGLAARYVSGYLETQPPPGSDRLVGADVSHAWVSVHVPAVGWVDVDPTNDVVPGDRHVTTAWGRDYSDVPPVRGVIFTNASNQDLAVSVDVVRL